MLATRNFSSECYYIIILSMSNDQCWHVLMSDSMWYMSVSVDLSRLQCLLVACQLWLSLLLMALYRYNISILSVILVEIEWSHLTLFDVGYVVFCSGCFLLIASEPVKLYVICYMIDGTRNDICLSLCVSVTYYTDCDGYSRAAGNSLCCDVIGWTRYFSEQFVFENSVSFLRCHHHQSTAAESSQSLVYCLCMWYSVFSLKQRLAYPHSPHCLAHNPPLPCKNLTEGCFQAQHIWCPTIRVFPI